MVCRFDSVTDMELSVSGVDFRATRMHTECGEIDQAVDARGESRLRRQIGRPQG